MSLAFDRPSDITAIAAALGLVLIFEAKQLIADFLLQSTAMARGKERREGWLLPLLAHAGVHGASTGAILLGLAPHLWWLAPVDWGIHALIDRAKAELSRRYRLTSDRPAYWWLLGFDQFLHHATHIALAGAVLLL